jgi:CRISPR-associated protein Cas5d
VPSYVGIFRAETQVERSISLVLPSMLHMVFDRPIGGRVAPVFRQNVEIREGVLDYAS